MSNAITIRHIITSQSTLLDEEECYLLGLYYALDTKEKFYHFEGSINNEYIVQYAEFYINNCAYVDVFGAEMYSPTPMHIVRYAQIFNEVNSTVLVYTNGAVCVDQGKDSVVNVHLWIDKSTVKNFDLLDPDGFNKLTLNQPL